MRFPASRRARSLVRDTCAPTRLCLAHENDAVPPPEVVKAFALIKRTAPEALDALHDALVATAATCRVSDPVGAVAAAASTYTSTVRRRT